MKESHRIWLKYEDQGLLDRLESLDDVNRLALTFCEAVARTSCLVTFRCNPSRDPSGYGLADAPIAGLLTRVAKLFQLDEARQFVKAALGRIDEETRKQNYSLNAYLPTRD